MWKLSSDLVCYIHTVIKFLLFIWKSNSYTILIVHLTLNSCYIWAWWVLHFGAINLACNTFLLSYWMYLNIFLHKRQNHGVHINSVSSHGSLPTKAIHKTLISYSIWLWPKIDLHWFPIVYCCASKQHLMLLVRTENMQFQWKQPTKEVTRITLRSPLYDRILALNCTQYEFMRET